MRNSYSEIAKLVRENNVAKLRDKLKSFEDEGRKFLQGFQYSLDKYVFF